MEQLAAVVDAVADLVYAMPGPGTIMGFAMSLVGTMLSMLATTTPELPPEEEVRATSLRMVLRDEFASAVSSK